MKILLAEDTRDLNRVITVALQHEGEVPQTGASGNYRVRPDGNSRCCRNTGGNLFHQ